MNNQIRSKKISISWGKRSIAYFLTFVILFQNAMAVSANVGSISNATIERDLFNNPLFQRAALDSLYQYIASELAENSIPANTTTLQDFINEAKNNGYSIASNVDQVKQVGSPLVQTRYIRYQVQNLLGRNLINGTDNKYQSESAQLHTLYNNALSYLMDSSSNASLGEPLNIDQEGGASIDMIWPEIREIHGEKVLVPVVYLTLDTVDERQVAGHRIEFGNQSNFEDLVIESVPVRFERDAFLNVAGDLENNGGQILAEENLNIIVNGDLNNNEGLIHSDCGLSIETGGDSDNNGGIVSSDCELKIVAGNNFSNLSGLVDATGNVVIGANSISNQTIVHRYDLGNRQGGSFGEIARINSNDGEVVLRAYENIDILGAVVKAGDSITLAAEGDIYIGGVKYAEGWQTDIESQSSVEYLGSLLRTNGDITLNANGQIVVNGSDILSSEGHLEFLAGLGISIIDDVISENYELKIHGKNTKEITEYKTFAMRSILDAGKGIRMRTVFGDVTLRATDITSSEGTDITADSGGINLLLTKEIDHYRYFEERNSTFSTTVKNGGHDFDNIVQNTIIGGLSATALTGVHVEYEGNGDRSFEQQMKFFESVDNLRWIAELQNNPDIDVDWTEIEKVYSAYYESSTSLNAAAMAIITIVIAIVTAGAGAVLLEAAIGTIGSTTAAVANVALTSLATTATLANINALVNGEGLFEATYAGISAVGEKENLKSLAISMVTAGVMSEIDSQFFSTEGAEQLAYQEGIDKGLSLSEIADNVRDAGRLSFGAQAAQLLTRASVSAGINVLAEGGNWEEFEDQFLASLSQSVVNIIGNQLAGEITAVANENLPGVFRDIAVIGASCLGGLISNGEEGCKSNAVGTVIGLVSTISYNEVNKGSIEDLLREGEEYYQSEFQDLSYDDIRTLDRFHSTPFATELIRLVDRSANLSAFWGALGAALVGRDVNLTSGAARLSSEQISNLFIVDLMDEIRRRDEFIMNISNLTPRIDNIFLDPNEYETTEKDIYIGGIKLTVIDTIEGFSVHSTAKLEELWAITEQFIAQMEYLEQNYGVEPVDISLDVNDPSAHFTPEPLIGDLLDEPERFVEEGVRVPRIFVPPNSNSGVRENFRLYHTRTEEEALQILFEDAPVMARIVNSLYHSGGEYYDWFHQRDRLANSVGAIIYHEIVPGRSQGAGQDPSNVFMVPSGIDAEKFPTYALDIALGVMGDLSSYDTSNMYGLYIVPATRFDENNAQTVARNVGLTTGTGSMFTGPIYVQDLEYGSVYRFQVHRDGTIDCTVSKHTGKSNLVGCLSNFPSD